MYTLYSIYIRYYIYRERERVPVHCQLVAKRQAAKHIVWQAISSHHNSAHGSDRIRSTKMYLNLLKRFYQTKSLIVNSFEFCYFK